MLALVGARNIVHVSRIRVNTLNAELNPIRYLLALVGARHFVHVSRVKVNKARRTSTLAEFAVIFGYTLEIEGIMNRTDNVFHTASNSSLKTSNILN